MSFLMSFLMPSLMSFLAGYWGMVASYADELTALGVALLVGGFYLRSKLP